MAKIETVYLWSNGRLWYLMRKENRCLSSPLQALIRGMGQVIILAAGIE